MSTTQSKKNRRVLFADYAGTKYQKVMDLLKEHAVESEVSSNLEHMVERVSKESFELCIVNLLFGGTGPQDLIGAIKEQSKNPSIRVIVVSRQLQRANIENTIKAGANDFVAEPFEPMVLYHRILYHLGPRLEVPSSGLEGEPPGPIEWAAVRLLIEGIDLVSRTHRNEDHATIYQILRSIAGYLESNRTSLIIVDAESNGGVVLASSDDPSFKDFPVSLANYPEIVHVMHSGNVVLIDDVSRNVITRRIQENVKSIPIGSVMVFPVRIHGDICGVVTVRRAKAREIPAMPILRVLQALANCMASHVNVKLILRKIYKDFETKTA